MDFKPVSLEMREEYYALWDQTPQKSIDYTLANLWGWQEFYGLEWSFTNGLCWVRRTKPTKEYWSPIGNWQETDWDKALSECTSDFTYEFKRVPERLLEILKQTLPGQIESSEERGQWEYLYSQAELAALQGPKFHKKRTHYNNYVKAYGEPDYRPVTDAMVRDVLNVQEDWCQTHECEDSPSLMAENTAINRVLDNWDKFRNFYGGSLYIDRVMVAFSVGEKLNDEILGVHFEKGLKGYKGIYQAINCSFARYAGAGFKYLNRAQDLDEEGLRQAKMTYMPVGFIKKYGVRFINFR